MDKYEVVIPPGFDLNDVDVRRIFMKGRTPGKSVCHVMKGRSVGLTDFHVETTGGRMMMPIIGRRAGIASALQIELQPEPTRRRTKLTTLASAIRTAIRMYAPQLSPMGHPVTLETVEKLESQLLVLITHIQMAMQPLDEESVANWLVQGEVLLSTGIPAELSQKFTAICQSLQQYHSLSKELRRHYSTGLPIVDTIKSMCMLLPTETPAIN